MPTKSKSPIPIKDRPGRRLPTDRPPTHRGEMIPEEFLTPLDMTQAELARRLEVPYPRLNEIVKGRRSVTPDTALRLSRVLGMSPDFWLGLQQDWDLWHAMNSPEANEIMRLEPILTDERRQPYVERNPRISAHSTLPARFTESCLLLGSLASRRAAHIGVRWTP